VNTVPDAGHLYPGQFIQANIADSGSLKPFDITTDHIGYPRKLESTHVELIDIENSSEFRTGHTRCISTDHIQRKFIDYLRIKKPVCTQSRRHRYLKRAVHKKSTQIQVLNSLSRACEKTAKCR